MRTVTSKLSDSCLYQWNPDFNVNHFFFEQNCFLKEQRFDGIVAGEIINHACKVHNLNQKFLLVTLQRESGIVACKTFEEADKKRNDFGLPVIEWACCCGLPDNIKDIKPQYKGFANQISGACSTYRKWYDYWMPSRNIALILDTTEPEVMTGSAITFSMLRYTPHLSVVNLNETLYKQYFGETK